MESQRNWNWNTHADAYSSTHSYAYSFTNSYRYRYSHRNSHGYCYPNSHRDGNRCTHTNGYGYGYTYCYSHGLPYAFLAHASPAEHTDPHSRLTDTYRYANTYAPGFANTDSYRHAASNAHPVIHAHSEPDTSSAAKYFHSAAR